MNHAARAKATLKPLKSLSQNFLTNPAIALRICNALHPAENSTVVEIGGGAGALTEHLAVINVDVICCDVDSRAIDLLRYKFPGAMYPRLSIVQEDVLELDFSAYGKVGRELYVIGNIPYAITSGILFHLFEQARYIKRAVLMMQREVALRLLAKPFSKDYGILSLAVQLVSNVSRVMDVKPGSFFPAPKVNSTVVALDFFSEQPTKHEYEQLMATVRQAFNYRRKRLRNALADFTMKQLSYDIREVNSELLDKRAEELSLDEFRALDRTLREHVRNA